MTDDDTVAQMSIAVVTRLYELGTTGDLEAVTALWAENATIVESEDHPFAGSYTGKEEMLRVSGRILGDLGMTGIEVREIIGNGNQVCVRLAVTYTNAAGATITRDVTEVSTVDDAGKILEIRPFYSDLAGVKAHLGL